MRAPAPANEAVRLRLLADYGVMDSAPDAELDAIVALASKLCGAPIALVSLVDETRQWFKAKVGLAAQQTPRDLAFCAHVIAAPSDDPFIVPDARTDPRFADNPLVTGDPNVVFYAAAPLVVEGGAKLGTLCVIDREPRQLSALQIEALATLSQVVVRHLQLRRETLERQAAEAQLQSVMDAIPVLVSFVDAEARYRLVNKAYATWFDVPQGDYPGRPLVDVLGAEAYARLEPLVLRALGGESYSVEIHDVPYRVGPPRDVRADFVAHFGKSGEADGYTCVLEDITAARREETERRRQAAFEQQLIGIVSHDLRNPLNVVQLGTSVLAAEPGLSAAATKIVARIRTATTRAINLVDDLLDFTRARLAGGIPVEPRAANLHDIVRAVGDEVLAAAPTRRITFAYEGVGAGTWDPDRLAQVVQNLLTNAVKYSPADSVVTVRVGSGADEVRLSIHNGGEAIAPGALATIFEPFQRAVSGHDQATRSVGLGLHIVKQIVEAHRGTVEVVSTGAGGTTFTVVLPRQPPS